MEDISILILAFMVGNVSKVKFSKYSEMIKKDRKKR